MKICLMIGLIRSFENMDRELNREARNTMGHRAANMMKTDVKEVEGGYEMDVDLPGCKKEDVKMQLEDGYLTIQAVRSHTNNESGQNGRYVRRETFSGTCARSFYVGDQIKKEDIHAKFEDGVLKITPAPCRGQEGAAQGQPQPDRY